MKQTMWLFHPESPGVRVLVCRNWWQRLLYPKDFATYKEVELYHLLSATNRNRGRL